ncbi:Acetyl-/propionyl-coenzyme A carboxylase alpha chain [Tepidimonas sediminis]|uniref:Acetyl-/propionyl-coenzyme A carboxylase alpha chain n=1 Tax=Tepidimonas sediminis TaxID=2588941 RepID=A0A554WUT8_9BURK|nr:urea carboxylase [Tepidimonas sediminis]TSE27338.1 Acetyl-/propionyl-coenzyme A carboxylase alpha chain [Tepidimonas sediminis]
MIDTVLIANRGAIACRIIRTLRRMGIRSVAVYSEADRDSLHVRQADVALPIGPAPAAQSYLRIERILQAARDAGAQAIHPGYGFLSENAAFAEACAAAGLTFIGPTPQQMRAFGLKHAARELAETHGVPLLPGSGLLADATHALAEAARIGYPVLLKSTGGGGGIGMRLVRAPEELREAFDAVQRLARGNFRDGGIFLEKYVERARHIEVQIFGDGRGHVVALGERDCSVQRRHQKVLEETPAPGLTARQRQALLEAAERLGRAVGYRSAGTVEFVLDADRGDFYFLEVNTRLQVEHGVTEEVLGVDLVEWMVREAAGELDLAGWTPHPRGHAIQARVYAEDPARDFQPCAGVLTEVALPAGVRVETWVERGTEVPPHYDPMLGKVIAVGADRAEALARLDAALAATRLGGIETNVAYLRRILADATFAAGRATTGLLRTLPHAPDGIEVLEPGLQTTVQDWPGRTGLWAVGVPPSGPMDALALRLANRLVGNPEGAAALEMTLTGPTLRFHRDGVIALAGADMGAELDGRPLANWSRHAVAAGSTLRLGAVRGPGARAYLAVRGGLDVPEYLGSRATFTLGQFGGHAGRALRGGDVLHLGAAPAVDDTALPACVPPAQRPAYGTHWTLGVLYGPHGAPDFFTDADVEMLLATDWEVHHNSSRTGVRLVGPKPQWARPDGGEAGLHPSNIHDNAYAIGAIDFTGDMPVILGPDGPSLGGFVCPAVVVQAERWKLGQLRPGDTVRFLPLTADEAAALQQAQDAFVAMLGTPPPAPAAPASPKPAPRQDIRLATPILLQRQPPQHPVGMTVRQSGDDYLLVEYGPQVLDIGLRLRVHALMEALERAGLPGILDLTPGIRSLQVHHDPARLPRRRLLDELAELDAALGAIDDWEVPSRIVHLPLSWDDAATRLAIERYMQTVRRDAPWCPSNLEFIRRINGLDSIEEVRRIVFDASYLVLGLGDVYLGAPVATPLDPRHRLVTTKYNPARTWTPENAVGIGGAYLCIYGMEGPGGYQFVGRTVQVWNRWRDARHGAAAFEPGRPWLLRFFDQIRFHPVSEEELLALRADLPSGRYTPRIEPTTFSLRAYRAFLTEHADSIAAFKARQQAAFEAERERWRALGLDAPMEAAALRDAAVDTELDLPPGARVVTSHVAGSVWKVEVAPGTVVDAGQTLAVVESMKMEFAVTAPHAGRVHRVLCREGATVAAGQELLVLVDA